MYVSLFVSLPNFGDISHTERKKKKILQSSRKTTIPS